MAEELNCRTETLIEAVKKRPILYNKHHPDYSNKDDKEQAWLDVCAEILPQWYDYGESDRNSKLFHVQRRWRNLRDSFRKDINLRREVKNPKKKREYIYYRSLLFLEPFLLKDDENKCDPPKLDEPEEEEEETSNTAVIKFESEESQYTDTSVGSRKRRKTKHISYETVPSQSPVLEVWEGSQNGEITEDSSFYLNPDIDEDRYFLLSLLPSFRNLPPQQKLSVKVEFLQVLQKFCFPNSEDPLNHSTN
ncbi:uncharacterized protein LOC130895685 [Diorhabda carinulata]|uniref:uncharacterized protein LOC130448210 n=1 Tax=Diorhabda sublineata TaxID=1163346 RepID=UPI0024E0B430|nr:uncharacterized protein LOC130448210 [Diorhabda sublineata]XP_057659132.1 uncharacterized protein LOC130895685 [Diorhabda carinulata]